jgi:signal transduction histidine kinase
MNIPAPRQVLGDAQRLYQVVSNLVSNAIKYTQPGGQITVALGASDEQVRLEVRDTGLGISPEAQARIFERFYRAPSVAADDRGTGLGLAIVKSRRAAWRARVGHQRDRPRFDVFVRCRLA